MWYSTIKTHQRMELSELCTLLCFFSGIFIYFSQVLFWSVTVTQGICRQLFSFLSIVLSSFYSGHLFCHLFVPLLSIPFCTAQVYLLKSWLTLPWFGLYATSSWLEWTAMFHIIRTFLKSKIIKLYFLSNLKSKRKIFKKVNRNIFKRVNARYAFSEILK